MRRRLRTALENVLVVVGLVLVVPFLVFALVVNNVIEWFERRNRDDETIPPQR